MNKNPHPSQFMSLLEAKNKTPEEVADALDVSIRAVYYWVSGEREPRLTITQVQALCTLLDCSIHELPRKFGRADIPGGEAIS